MEFSAWATLATICLMGAMMPGPSLVVVLKHTVAGGRRNGLVTGIAHGFGMACYATLTIMGLAAVINESPLLFNVIRYASVIFLLWMAYQALTSKSALSKLEQHSGSVTIKQSFFEGLMITFLNPKLALFSQFIQAEAGWQQNIVLVGTAAGIDTLWYCLIAVVLSQSAMLNKLRNNTHIIEKITGIVLLLIAARVLVE
jgi:threonine/homoserine/homoserine lactone efflux protein